MWKWLEEFIGVSSTLRLTKEYKKPKRARTKKGRYRADNKSTAGYNEAWVGGKKPRKKRKRIKKYDKPWAGNI